jgi:hypothetical protein
VNYFNKIVVLDGCLISFYVIDIYNGMEHIKLLSKVRPKEVPKVHRRNRGIGLLIHNLGARRCGWSSPRPGRFTPGKDPVYIVQEAGWAPGPVWTGAKNISYILTKYFARDQRFILSPELLNIYGDFSVPFSIT